MTHFPSRRIVCALLCLLTWRGPIPMVHCHGAEDSDASATIDHLETYHGDDLAALPSWHFHLMLWRDVAADCGDEDSRDVPHDQDIVIHCLEKAVCGSAAWRGIVDHALCFRCCAWKPPHEDRVMGNKRTQLRGSTYLTSLLFARPRCAVLGVSLC